jgi:hypothetical protein
MGRSSHCERDPAASISFARATIKASFLLLCLVVLLAHGAATTRGQSALDGFDPNANDLILAI